MNKVIPLVALATAAVVTTLILGGCGGNDQQASNNPASQKHLDTFLTLHNKFCEKHYESRDVLKRAIESDSSFKQAQGFDGVYETMVDDVSFAVSPEDDGCTTDVMVQKGGKTMFRFEDINSALLAKGYKETGKQTSRKDVGTDQSELTIIEKTYISPTGEITTLDFPLEKMDKYYMTLFAEKFKEAKQEIRERSVTSLKMASAI